MVECGYWRERSGLCREEQGGQFPWTGTYLELPATRSLVRFKRGGCLHKGSEAVRQDRYGRASVCKSGLSSRVRRRRASDRPIRGLVALIIEEHDVDEVACQVVCPQHIVGSPRFDDGRRHAGAHASSETVADCLDALKRACFIIETRRGLRPTQSFTFMMEDGERSRSSLETDLWRMRPRISRGSRIAWMGSGRASPRSCLS